LIAFSDAAVVTVDVFIIESIESIAVGAIEVECWRAGSGAAACAVRTRVDGAGVASEVGEAEGEVCAAEDDRLPAEGEGVDGTGEGLVVADDVAERGDGLRENGGRGQPRCGAERGLDACDLGLGIRP